MSIGARAAAVAPDLPSTMWVVARRPRWIGMLVLALVIAAGFAGLGQWQLGRSLDEGRVVDRATETTVPLGDVAEPQGPVSDAAAGQLVETSGRFVPGDYLVVTGRIDHGAEGAWVVGRFETADGAGDSGPATLAVALGWAPDARAARSVADGLAAADTAGAGPGAGDSAVLGRYLPGETPQTGEFESGALDTLSPSQLVNLWQDFEGDVFGGFVVSAQAPEGLTTIESPAPDETRSLNLLNLFYAIEWAVFAGFAVFMWYRLVKDAWEREVDPDGDEYLGDDDDDDLDGGGVDPDGLDARAASRRDAGGRSAAGSRAGTGR